MDVDSQRAESNSLKAHHVHFQETSLLPSTKGLRTTEGLRDKLKEQRSQSLPSNAFKNLAIDDALQSTGRHPRSESLKELALPHQPADHDNTVNELQKSKSGSLKAHHVHFRDDNLLPSTERVKSGLLRDCLKDKRSKSLPNNAFKNLAIDDANESTNRHKITPRSESLKELAIPHHEHFVFDDDSAIFLNRVDDLFQPHSKSLPKGENDEVNKPIPECNEEEEDDAA